MQKIYGKTGNFKNLNMVKNILKIKLIIILLCFYSNLFSQKSTIYKVDKLLFNTCESDILISGIEKNENNYIINFTFKSNSDHPRYIKYQRISYDDNQLAKINEFPSKTEKSISAFDIYKFSLNIPISANYILFKNFQVSRAYISSEIHDFIIKLSANELPDYIKNDTKRIYDFSIYFKDIYQNNAVSNVDINIPVNNKKNLNKYALIFGNEDYKTYQKGLSAEANVEFAKNDAKIFKEYCEKTLGIPTENILLNLDADAKKMKTDIEKMFKIIKLIGKESELIFYYSGHGLPDEATKSPYLIPVDVAGTELNEALKLNDICRKFSETSCSKVTFFIDACFSGKARSNAPLISKRSISIVPNDLSINGNTIVFSATSNTLAAYPLKSEQHGLFTYYLLKKLQETSGNITYSEMFEYLSKKVGTESLKLLNAEQEPSINKSPDIENVWQNWKF